MEKFTYPKYTSKGPIDVRISVHNQDQITVSPEALKVLRETQVPLMYQKNGQEYHVFCDNDGDYRALRLTGYRPNGEPTYVNEADRAEEMFHFQDEE